jgi:MFS transporter, DHA2 family, multidrug resistance protein
VAAGSVIFSVALAPADTLATDLAVGAAPPQRAGAASAVTETSAESGGALGIAVLGVVGTAVYRDQMAGSIPAGVPDQAAAVAQDTLGGAAAVASELPDPLGAALLEAAREAFTHGLRLAATVSAAASLAFAVLVVVLLRGVRLTPPPDEATSDRVAGTGFEPVSATPATYSRSDRDSVLWPLRITAVFLPLAIRQFRRQAR